MQIAVVGSGTMGLGIVSVFAQYSEVSSILWWGRESGAICSRKESLVREIKKICRKNGFAKSDADTLLSKVEVIHSFDSIGAADFVIEAVAEDMDVKKTLLSDLSNYVSDNAVVVTNTSSLSITELSMCFRNPERFLGIHFFNPANIMKLVEVVAGLATSRDAVDRAVEVIEGLGKEAVIVNDSPGFVVNRMLIPMINEGISVMAEGVATREDIDKAMKLGANHPIGPISLADFIGTDVCLSIMDTLHKETGDPKYRAHPLLRKYVRAGRLGRKVKRGFYDY
ncbi:3-hydroxyacyl-CoA dehydrogenase family protein [Neptuniibacter pectenicola]|uniref:3-hydroxyacyl-CoA dehydrogenase family protein n=1 Tax=Neptuniibacter pectenicola TaxID=1806669 RepID=UPI00082C1D80|nr:3-hydroxyacyl-CoA dehydrogenase NAD-binding domain-containing protein [Neptuniibacter pectenicola]